MLYCNAFVRSNCLLRLTTDLPFDKQQNVLNLYVHGNPSYLRANHMHLQQRKSSIWHRSAIKMC